MNSPSRPGDLSLASVLDLIRYRLAVLIEAIIANHPVVIYRSPMPWSWLNRRAELSASHVPSLTKGSSFMVVITQHMIRQQMELQLASHEWTEALSQALDSRGFRSLTDYADSLAAASLTELASDLGGSPFALEQRLVAEAEATGTMERCARGLFARALRDELPDGWQPDEPGRCTAIVAQLYRIAGIFLMLLMALPESYHGAVERVELVMGRVELPAGWRPEGSDDPILIELFGSCWHAAPV